MSIQVLAYAASDATSPLAPWRFERRAMRPDDVLIDILYCGVCHTDLHLSRNDWNSSKFPIVPGHEIIGRVSAVGESVVGFQAGDRVAVGCMVDSCHQCAPCAKGQEQYCAAAATFTYNGVDRHDGRPTYGGYSDKIVVAQDFVLKLPPGLDPAAAAPLLCAGITTWSPLRHWQVGEGSRVAVVGLGGLGHMALKLAKALGAEVSLFTRSPGKEADARALGADRVVLSTSAEQMAAVQNQFDLIIDTVPYDHDVNLYLPSLAVDGALVLVGFLGELGQGLNTSALVRQRKTVAGSLIGGIEETQELLNFCAQHGIAAEVEVIAIQEINQAFERMLKSDVKYRFVIDMASLQAQR